jgi:hypothetical protein
MADSSDEEQVAGLNVVHALVLQAADPLRLFHPRENYPEFMLEQCDDIGVIEDEDEDDPDEFVRWLCSAIPGAWARFIILVSSSTQLMVLIETIACAGVRCHLMRGIGCGMTTFVC